ncbi:MAG: radical SAM protein [Spirochaetales bacterium]|nr:radical SAM protein [Spirochaetales bacterium]
MKSADYYINFFNVVYITKDALPYEASAKALKALRALPVKEISAKDEIPEKDLNRHTLLITTAKGETVARCPGSKGHVCCNYLTVDLYLGCMLDCSYCIMQGYLNFAPITVYVNNEVAIKKIINIRRRNPGVPIRIGTGEVGDSLALDSLFHLSQDFIKKLAEYKDLFFELKTKTHFVDHLLELEPKGNAVIGFSLNPDIIIASEEKRASSLAERLAAAGKAVRAGYLVSFHFDPIILIKNWESVYRETVLRLAAFDSRKIAWISLGTMRYTKFLREQMQERDYLYDEFVPCRDGKYRYLKPVRERVYMLMKEWISGIGKIPLYMCMESTGIWRNVFGKLPGKITELCAIFTNVKKIR